MDNVSHVFDYSANGIFISAGAHIYLALNRQFRTTKPYGNCDDLSINNFKSNLYDLIYLSQYDYTPQHWTILGTMLARIKSRFFKHHLKWNLGGQQIYLGPIFSDSPCKVRICGKFSAHFDQHSL